MTREEALAQKARREKEARLAAESRELAKGPSDMPFFLLVILLTGIGLVMLFSASFPRAYYDSDIGNPAHYLIRQGLFAVMGISAMLASPVRTLAAIRPVAYPRS